MRVDSSSNLKMLTAYNAWATHALYECLSMVPEHQLTAPREIVFGSIVRTLNHVCLMDEVWQCHLEGRTHSLTSRNPSECPDFSDIMKQQAAMNDWYIECAASMTAAHESERLEFDLIGGTPCVMSRSEIVLHVVNHTTYHRGHIATMIYQIPAEPPTTDLPVFLREFAR